jgi:MYXO-CTERM domain-containing protein
MRWRGVLSAIALLVSAPSPTRAETLACRTLRGPCQFLDTVDVFLGGAAPTLVMNFGLAARAASGRLEYACEGALGALAVRARAAPDGQIFVAADDGVFRYQRSCAGGAAAGDVANRPMRDVVFDLRDRQRVWALGADGPAVYVSTDGGASFSRAFTFSPAQDVLQLRAAADTLYGAGERPNNGGLLLVRSDDGGRSFADVLATPPPDLPLALLGVDPANRDSLFVALRAPDGADAIWRSRDGGRTLARVLTLPTGEILAGFTFGSGRTIFAAGRAQIFLPNTAPAHLYVSRDGGDTWDAPIASPQNGPRYRCLGFRDDRLYACAGGAPNGDTFLLGSSPDGKTWTPLMTVAELAGPEPCMRESCATTTAWLCDMYQLCPGAAPDASADAATTTDGGGCGCATGGRPRSVAPLLLVVLSLALCWRRRKESR